MASTGDTPGGFLDKYPGVDNHSCQLLGPTALIVQGLMGVLVILSLVYKRHGETPKRPWRIWLFDVSKQVVGQMFVHGVNVFVSHLGSNNTESNACVFYFLNILIDTTLGVALIYVTLHLLTYLFSEKLKLKGFESGVYGSPPSVKYWARQAAIYVLALTTMKMLVVGLLALFPGIFKIGEWILSWTWTEDGDAVQVIFTMGIFPIIMNIVQFWLIDSIVKSSNTLSSDSSSPNAQDDEHREPLFGVPSDDEDEEVYKPRDIENQRQDRYSQSSTESRDKSFSTEISVPDEIKSLASTSTSALRDEHSYPPSLSSSITSAESPNDNLKVIKPAKNLMKKKRRGPPAPLFIQPNHHPAINSPQPSAAPLEVPGPKTPIQPAKETHPPAIANQTGTQSDITEWAESWDDADDWATRIGEEEWTGRRLEDKSKAINGIWGANGASKLGTH
ncbi:hypothetical protein P691DRAFT_700883 [Macrolepiota fuliginosa MF-IS2]|uniref:Vacuolar membrane protein n=1 Tax=Macrolepiota fuliginosa MF-IS2 TaxID=1400762 RepID=A0A9P5XFX3_9AGAR|nr:hypothetical protein P691DRAFT_700883 [Macrolepiota fuliginosa MF-IS2]